jgi:PAS domain S-box-containing protein
MSTDPASVDPIAAALLRWLDEHAAGGVLTTDTALVVRSWNRWLSTVTGLSASDVIGRPLFDLVPSLGERGFEAYFREALAGQIKMLSHTLHRHIIPCPRPGGELMPQSGRIAPLVNGDQVIGTITVIEDVSDRVNTEKQLRAQIAAAEDARHQAESASRAKDEFLATLSHEIRTPLSAVLGWVHLLRAREPDLATVKRAVEVIERNAQSQLTLISDMLDMARISSGKMRLEMASVNMTSVITSATDAVRPTADLKAIRVVTDVPGTVVQVIGDADRLLQVVWNLLSNAVKFTGEGGLVVVSLRADGHGVHLSVADTGQGIEAKFLPQVFDRFKQADTSAARKAGGLGLGLALVKDLVALHGGHVAVESPGPGFGATFSVHLPNPIAMPAPSTPPPSRTATAATLDGVNVLIVEDDPDARDIAARTIADAGGQFITAVNATEALAALAASGTRLDALISDIGLPGTDGFSLLDAVRALPNSRGAIPAIAVTAYAGADDAAKALQRGFSAHIAKPYVPSALVAAVRHAVDRRPSRSDGRVNQSAAP